MNETAGTVNPLRNAALSVRVRLLLSEGASPRYARRAAKMLASSILSAPMAARERRCFEAAIRDSQITEGPVFIVGHWRSGTTHLHSLMAQDKRFGFASLFQVALPRVFLTQQRLKDRMADRLPGTRPMDGMALAPDLPQEEEFAIANLCPYSFYHALTYPSKMRRFFDRYVLFDGAGPKKIARWGAVYSSFLKKVTMARGGRPLVLKSPVNTARIPFVLKVFPSARFIHLYRNPFRVFPSTTQMLEQLSKGMRLQGLTREAIETQVFYGYRAMMTRFQADLPQIPPGTLVEVPYEDLIESPLEVLSRVYDELGLGDFAPAREAVARYLDAQREYRVNRFRLPAPLVARIATEWGEQINAWGYAPPQTAS